MGIEEYFGEWSKVIPSKELAQIMTWLPKEQDLCPSIQNVFKAFKVTPYNKCTQIWIGLDPYPQKGVATGLLFANSSETPEDSISPSLRIIRDAMIDYTIPKYTVKFDLTMESIAKQGVLLLNGSLSCKVGEIGSHASRWRPFMSQFLRNMTSTNSGLVIVLFGNYAKSFQSDILGFQHILIERHPAYYARRGEEMSPNIFYEINKLSEQLNGYKIQYYEI